VRWALRLAVGCQVNRDQQYVSITRRLKELDPFNEDHQGEIAELRSYLDQLLEEDEVCPTCND
jgi:hypothetical protein